MGLFGKKEPCAICGGKVSGLFPAKIDGYRVCSDCYGKVDLPDGMEKAMTLLEEAQRKCEDIYIETDDTEEEPADLEGGGV